ncbi:MAG TPA: hypothetical protein PKE64_14115 [Anaerolineae bacterium]|nr:hypothetical protein [Anaerolineae bacterium]HMR65138.1 hypothetical protein [Anaerolineae bacterium]
MSTFYFILLQAHSGWRYVVLLLVILTTAKVVVGWLGNQAWTKLDSRLMSYTNIAIGIQFLLGLFLYTLFIVNGGMGRSIGGFTGGHVVPAILAVAAAGFGFARSRRVEGDRRKFMFAAIGMLLAIFLVYGALATVGGVFASSSFTDPN